MCATTVRKSHSERVPPPMPQARCDTFSPRDVCLPLRYVHAHTFLSVVQTRGHPATRFSSDAAPTAHDPRVCRRTSVIACLPTREAIRACARALRRDKRQNHTESSPTMPSIPPGIRASDNAAAQQRQRSRDAAALPRRNVRRAWRKTQRQRYVATVEDYRIQKPTQQHGSLTPNDRRRRNQRILLAEDVQTLITVTRSATPCQQPAAEAWRPPGRSKKAPGRVTLRRDTAQQYGCCCPSFNRCLPVTFVAPAVALFACREQTSAVFR